MDGLQRRETAHRQTCDVRAVYAPVPKHIADIVAGPFLRVACNILGHVRRRVSPGVERDAAEPPRQIAHLGFPAAMIPRKLVNEDQGDAGARFLEI
jgi:hypothetical protein